MASPINVDSDEDAPPFDETRWRRCGARWNESDPGLTRALSCLLDFESVVGRVAFDSLIPWASGPVGSLLACTTLPQVATALVTVAAENFFSRDPPDAPFNMSVLRQWPVPPPTTVDAVLAAVGQAWLDGFESVVYAHTNLAVRFPLCVIRYWAIILKVYEHRAVWESSLTWLDRQQASGELLANCRHLLLSLPWSGDTTAFGDENMALPYLATILSSSWIANFTIDFVLHTTAARADPTLRAYFASVTFSYELHRTYTMKKRSSDYLTALGQSLSEGKYDHIFAVMHNVYPQNSWQPSQNPRSVNHWCALHIDWKSKKIAYHDSLGPQLPDLLRRALVWWLQMWTKVRFAFDNTGFRSAGQNDGISCGIFALNLIRHVALPGVPLFTDGGNDPVVTRLQYFQEIATHELTNRALISDPLPAPASNPGPVPDTSQQDRPVLHIPISAADSTPVVPSQLVQPPAVGTPVPKRTIAELLMQSTEATSAPRASSSSSSKRRPSEDASSSDSDDADAVVVYKRPRASESTASKQSRSAQHAKAARAAVKAGTFTPDPGRAERWKSTILGLDASAEVNMDSCKDVCCSQCGVWWKMKQPYDATRFRTHVESPTACLEAQSRKKAGKRSVRRPDQKVTPWSRSAVAQTSTTQKSPAAHDTETSPAPSACAASDMAPSSVRSTPSLSTTSARCLGLRSCDYEDVAVILQHGSPGGGARSKSKIAEEEFQQPSFDDLTPEQKVAVQILQKSEWAWICHADLGVIFAVDCEKTLRLPSPDAERVCSKCTLLLKNRRFRSIANKPLPKAENRKYTPKEYRNSAQASAALAILGLDGLLASDKEDQNDVLLRFTQGAVRGDYKDEKVFFGLMDAMVTLKDKERRGVGMQNMRWVPEYDDVMHQMAMASNSAFQAYKRYLPGRSQRSFQILRARGPRFMPGIHDDITRICKKYADEHDYHDVFALACDETKVALGWRTCPNPTGDAESFYLIGAVGPPIHFSTVDELRALLTRERPKQAEKIRVWHLVIPVPGVPSQPICVMPVDEKNDALQLLEWHNGVFAKAEAAGLKILSYSCDGTAVELGVQKRITDTAAEHLSYVFEHPVHDQPRIEIRIPLSAQRTPTVMIQDSKHCRKDCRNTILSGARFLVIGNYTITYSQLRAIADEPLSPLKLRDVDSRLDRQDDFAAARTFGAATLAYIVKRHPDWRGLIVYLFVFGELIDAYQSRTMSNRTRVTIAFRTLFFLELWQAFLKKGGYSQAYGMAPETIKIIQTECYGIVGLILAHRDHRSDPNLPLCPWMHSTESAEHNYGFARKILPNFTVMDYLLMLYKIYLLMMAWYTSMRAGTKQKTTASGYNHTYFDATKFDSRTAAECPADEVIQADIRVAYDQATNLMASLGVVAKELELQSNALPSLSTLLERTGLDSDRLDVEGPRGAPAHNLPCDTTTLLDDFFAGRHEDQLLRAETEERLEELHRAHVSSMMLDAELVDSLPLPNDEDIARGREWIRNIIQHQSQEAVDAARKYSDTAEDGEDEDEILGAANIQKQREVVEQRREIVMQVTAVLREENDFVRDYKGTGSYAVSDRLRRWQSRANAATEEQQTGNAANAALAADARAKKRDEARAKVYRMFTHIHPAITSANISTTSTLIPGVYILYWVTDILYLGRVITFYSKGGGKAGRHGFVTKAVSAGQLSYVCVQAFEFVYGRHFRARFGACGAMGVYTFHQVPYHRVLFNLSTFHQVVVVDQEVRIPEPAFEVFRRARDSEGIQTALRALNPRTKQGQRLEAGLDESDDE
ncbi:hypothetical protein EXIGLDRAFT_767081 [Exidia glandulosa HHB12029]|uniref:Ubiquitin-like protease family profile domain-containing protein n=1 Tax=Exidia glandulosa HHB12029 TaxID=1314781 RepID=A0A165J7D6_EXIGL|nr:hypothetical protein EXIGLDRAFT_767081 [Exidia glandulosa HHB12029]